MKFISSADFAHLVHIYDLATKGVEITPDHLKDRFDTQLARQVAESIMNMTEFGGEEAETIVDITVRKCYKGVVSCWCGYGGTYKKEERDADAC